MLYYYSYRIGSAYTTFARALLKPETLNAEKVQIEGGLASTTITESTDTTNKKQLRKQRILRKNLEKNQSITPDLSANYFNQDVTHVSLSVNIAPYEDRIIIPKIGKNIPLVDVESHNADSSNEWNEIFMKELENGIVNNPAFGHPGQKETVSYSVIVPIIHGQNEIIMMSLRS